MASREVENKWKSCSFVLSAYQVHREGILTGLADLTRKSASPDPLPTEESQSTEGLSSPTEDLSSPTATFFFRPEVTSIDEAKEKIGWFLDGVVDTMEGRAIGMIDADEANQTELKAGKKKRKRRNKVLNDLVGLYVRQRNTIANLYGQEMAEEAGFDLVVEREPSPFHLQLRRVVNRFKSGEVFFEESSGFGGTEVDPIAYGRDLEAGLEKLEKVLEDIRLEVREIQGKTDAKRVAIAAHDEVFVPGARCIEAAFRLAGMKNLGDRVRPSTRRPGRLVDEVPGEGDNPDAIEPDFRVLNIDEPPIPTAAARAQVAIEEEAKPPALADA